MKTCTKCLVSKELEANFSKSKTHAGGYSTWCKACHKQRMTETQTKYYERALSWKKENIDLMRAYAASYRDRDGVREKAAERSRIWRKLNPGKLSALSAQNEEARKQAMPEWANRHLINFIYTTRRYIQMETSERWQVDHVIPIKGKTVCGLHVHNNLQIVTADYNRKKSNKFF